ncbi:MAG: VOC family protein [Rhizobiaceae bacterium]|nr:VOC family protein [Rhizobiaceae bacterium]
MTSDPAAAQTFYADVMGWKPEPFPAADDYTILMAGDRGIGGLMAIPEEARANGMPPAWVGYIASKDIEADVNALKKAGGTVHRGPMEIGGGVGKIVVASDPQGAMYMMIEPQGPDQPPAEPMTPGHVGWNELMADDWQAAFAYYSGLYGWTKGEPMDMGEMGIYQIIAHNGVDMGAMMNRPANVPVCWGFYFIVDGIDAAVARVKSGGGKILMEPMVVPGNQWVANCTDPQGAHFGMVSNTK